MTGRGYGSPSATVLGLALVLSALGGLSTSSASADVPPPWSLTRIVLPPQAAIEESGLPGVSCWGAGNCEAVGTFIDASGEGKPMAVADYGGIWQQAGQIDLPADANPYAPSGGLRRISCSQPGWCGAFGYYEDVSGHLRPMVASENAGVWSAATEVQLPAAQEAQEASEDLLQSISCSGPGSCVAVGTYIEAPHETWRAIVVRSSGGIWEQTATRIATPAEANIPYAALASVSCWAPGSCTAVGRYQETYEGRGATRPLSVSEIGGTWRSASDIALPHAREAGGKLESVVCEPSSACEAVGRRYGAGGQSFPIFVAGAGGEWQAPVEVELPPEGIPGEGAELLQISCAAEDLCAAIGTYRGEDGGDFHAMFDSGTIGSLGQAAQKVTTPFGNGDYVESWINDISCTSGPLCEMTGRYRNDETFEKKMFLAESGSPFTPTAQVPQVALAGREEANFGLTSCAAGACVTVGSASGPGAPVAVAFSAGQAEAPSFGQAQAPGTGGSSTSPATRGGPATSRGAHRSIGVEATSLRLTGHRLSVRIFCRRATSCHGRLRLVRSVRVARGHKTVSARTLLASAAYRLRAGTGKRLTLKLTSVGRRLLIATQPMRSLTARLVVTEAGGRLHSTRVRVVARAQVHALSHARDP